MTSWPVEEIPGEDSLFYRVHRDLLGAAGTIRPNVFREQSGAMSTDWERYSTPEETRQRAKDPDANGVLALPCALVRAVDGCSVVHSPQSSNRAHTNVYGVGADKVRIRLQLFKLVEHHGWVVPVGGN